MAFLIVIFFVLLFFLKVLLWDVTGLIPTVYKSVKAAILLAVTIIDCTITCITVVFSTCRNVYDVLFSIFGSSNNNNRESRENDVMLTSDSHYVGGNPFDTMYITDNRGPHRHEGDNTQPRFDHLTSGATEQDQLRWAFTESRTLSSSHMHNHYDGGHVCARVRPEPSAPPLSTLYLVD